jgi:hypothetical protein
MVRTDHWITGIESATRAVQAAGIRKKNLSHMKNKDNPAACQRAVAGKMSGERNAPSFGLRLNGLLLGLLLLLSLSACERLLIEPNPANAPVQNFDLLWREVDQKYAYFDLKRIHWDSVYAEFRPRVHNEMTQRELFGVMADMLFLLRDGHVNLMSRFDVARNWEWFLDHPQNFNFSLIERNYLGRDHQIARPFRTTVIDSVAYIYYGSFLSIISETTLDLLIEQYAGLKGLIIDVRNNGGGSIAMVDVLASRFAGERRLVGYSRYKDGPGHNDFTRFYPRYLDPEEKKQFAMPVVVLTNRSVYSAANDFVSTMSQLPQVTLVGDTSGGGGGAPYSGELMNGWSYRFSSTQLFNGALEHIEDGVPPDIKVDMKPEDALQGRDTILETALELLR